MDIATSLDQTLKAAGIPIIGISIGRTDDRATWRVQFAADVTPDQRDAAADLLTKFKLSSLDVPEVVSRFRAKAALLQLGRLAEVEAVFADPRIDPIAKLAWTDAQYFTRSSPLFAAFAQALGWTDAEIDAVFIAAARIPT